MKKPKEVAATGIGGSLRPLLEARKALAKIQSPPPAPPKKNPHAPQGKVPQGIRGLVRRSKRDLNVEAARKWAGEPDPKAGNWVQRSPAWALSLAAHLVAAVIMMNVVYFTQNGRIGQVFRMTLRAAAPGGEHQGQQDNGVNGKDNEDSPPAGPVDPSLPLNPGTGTVRPNEGVAAAVPIRVDAGPASGKEGPGGIYAGRGGEGRGEALKKFGGDGVSEEAVMKGLKWLAAHQDADGKWSPGSYMQRCRPARGPSCSDGPERNGYRYFDAYTSAMTGLCVLAFLGAGYSHLDDHLRPQDQGGPVTHEFTQTIEKALRFLARMQRRDGLIVSSSHELPRAMYSHGMAGLALIEAYSVTHDERLRSHAQMAVNAIVRAQQRTGGWDYSPDSTGRSDTSITSWQVMALRSARAAGLSVPRKVWDRARGYMVAVTDLKQGSIGYEIEGPNETVGAGCNAMVAAGWITRMYLGISEDHPTQEKFRQVLERVPPRYDREWGKCGHWSELVNRKADGHWSLYYTYYGTLAMFHHGGQPWELWNAKMRGCTLTSQVKTGHEEGSWSPVTSDGMWGGRVYCTAMNVMNLEIYYRYLPCYQVGAEFGMADLVADEDWGSIQDNTRKGSFGDVPDEKAAEKAELEQKTVAELMTELKSTEMMLRRGAAKELCRRKEATAVEALIHAAKTEKTSLRPVLVEYLGDFSGSDAIFEYLIGELGSESARVRTAAYEALTRATGEDLGLNPVDWRAWKKDRDAKKSKGK